MAQENVIETKMDVDAPNNGEAVPFRVVLGNLEGYPLQMEFDANSSITDMTSSLQKHLKLEQSLKLQTPIPFDSIPPCFDIKVGNADRIDFDANRFTIAKDTRFVEYWNDFLEAVTMAEEQKEQTEGEVQYDGKLKALLNGTTLTIGDARIQFQRTLRIPDDDKTYPLPPSLGQFPC